MSSLKKQAIQGTLWTIVSYGGAQTLRFGGNLILTRLLAPDLFGLMALINTFIIGLQLFSDTGVGPNIIQHKRGEEPIFLNTAWTLQVVRGFCLWGGSLLLTWPIAKFYDNPQLLWLFPLAGLTTITTGFEATSLSVLNRRMALREISIYELGSQALSLIVFITWALIHPSIWALIGGNIIGSSLSTFWSHRLLPDFKNHFAWNQEVAQELFSFGRWIFISTILTFFATQIDRLALGKLFTLELLGIYGIAYALSDIPRQVIAAVSGKVLFAAFSKMTDLPRDEFRSKILKNRKYILLVAGLGLAILASFGDLVIGFLYDQRYAQGRWMLPLLAIGIWPAVLSQSIDRALLAIGKPQYVSLANLFKTIFMAVGIPLGFSLAGPLGAVSVVALNDLPFHAAVTFGLWRENLNCLIQDILTTLFVIAVIAILVTGRFFLGGGLPFEMLLH